MNLETWKLRERTHASDVYSKLMLEGHPLWQDPQGREAIITALGFTLAQMEQAVDLLSEFAKDCRVVGEAELELEWPDLLETYRKVTAFFERN